MPSSYAGSQIHLFKFPYSLPNSPSHLYRGWPQPQGSVSARAKMVRGNAGAAPDTSPAPGGLQGWNGARAILWAKSRPAAQDSGQWRPGWCLEWSASREERHRGRAGRRQTGKQPGKQKNLEGYTVKISKPGAHCLKKEAGKTEEGSVHFGPKPKAETPRKLLF